MQPIPIYPIMQIMNVSKMFMPPSYSIDLLYVSNILSVILDYTSKILHHHSMGAPERGLINNYLSELPDNMRMFRINAGMGWAGEVVRKDDNMLILRNPRPFRGAPDSWPDLFGWTTVTITPDMVGQKIAVASGTEVKATGNLSKGQKKFGEILSKMGGIFKVLRPSK